MWLGGRWPGGWRWLWVENFLKVEIIFETLVKIFLGRCALSSSPSSRSSERTSLKLSSSFSYPSQEKRDHCRQGVVSSENTLLKITFISIQYESSNIHPTNLTNPQWKGRRGQVESWSLREHPPWLLGPLHNHWAGHWKGIDDGSIITITTTTTTTLPTRQASTPTEQRSTTTDAALTPVTEPSSTPSGNSH